MTAPRRADARRNRALLLDAAETVFAQRGIGASTEEVAKAAGVGVGTLFRHFPTKEALLRALYQARLEHLAEQARTLTATTDPGNGFFTLFRDGVAGSTSKLALVEALAEAGIEVHDASGDAGREVTEALAGLLAAAQEAGAVRRDVTVVDVMALLVGASRAAQHAPNAQIRARSVEVILDGLRPRD
jgi:AcrR family transcriptional regulator